MSAKIGGPSPITTAPIYSACQPSQPSIPLVDSIQQKLNRASTCILQLRRNLLCNCPSIRGSAAPVPDVVVASSVVGLDSSGNMPTMGSTRIIRRPKARCLQCETRRFG